MDTPTLIARIVAASQRALARSDLEEYARLVSWIPSGDEQQNYTATENDNRENVLYPGITIECRGYNWRCRSCHRTWIRTRQGPPVRDHSADCPVRALENPSDGNVKRLCDHLLLARRAAQGTDEMPSIATAVEHIEAGGAWIVLTRNGQHKLIDRPEAMRELLEYQAANPHAPAHRRYLAILGGMAVVPHHKEPV